MSLAISCNTVPNPPRVGSLNSFIFSPNASSKSFTKKFKLVVSLTKSDSNSKPSRSLIMAIPCCAMKPFNKILSPAFMLCTEILALGCTCPNPVVLMKILSPFPRSTTLVSPVIMSTPLSSAAFFTEATIFSNSVIFKPSSIIKAKDKYFGMAPHMATSFTVPFTASSPMFPPLKKMGVITKLSVEMAILEWTSTIAPSCF